MAGIMAGVGAGAAWPGAPEALASGKLRRGGGSLSCFATQARTAWAIGDWQHGTHMKQYAEVTENLKGQKQGGG